MANKEKKLELHEAINKKSNLFLDVLLQTSSELIFILDDQYRIINCSGKVLDFFGWGNRNLIGKNFLSIAKTKKYRDFFPDNIASCLKHKRCLPKNCEIMLEPNWHKRKDRIVIQWRLIKAGKGNVLLYGQDLSELRDARSKLFELDNIIALLPGNIFWKDIHSTYQGCNEIFADFIGISDRKKIINMSDYDVAGLTNWSKSLVKFFRENDKRVMAKDEIIKVEETLTSSKNKKISVITSKAPYKNERGKIVGIVGTSLDITEVKQAQKDLQQAKERAEVVSRAKSEFIANMQHDLSTPLGHIMGMTEHLKLEHELPGDLKQNIDLIDTSAKRVFNLVSEILSFVDVEAGRVTAKEVKFNLATLVQSIAEMFRPSAVEKNIDLLYTVDKKIPPVLIGDKIRLHRVIMNLINNALKFTNKGFVKVSAKLLKRTQHNGVVVNISVEDTGIGIPEEKQDSIFEKFVRLTAANQNKYPGLGLGLAIVKQFVDELEGEIELESKKGKGSKFVCLFPFRVSLADKSYVSDKVSEQVSTSTSPVYQMPVFSPGVARSTTLPAPTKKDKDLAVQTNKGKILLLEDEPIGVMIAKGNIERCGYKVDVAGSIHEAIKLVNDNDYALILCDLGLPDGNGLEFVSHVRNKLGKTKLPILAFTAHSSYNKGKECMAAGMNDFVEKPLTYEKADKILHKWGKFLKTKQK